MRRLRATRTLARLASTLVDDVAAFVFPETCLHCGASELDAGAAPVPSRLHDGRLRRPLVGGFSLPLRLLCPTCCSQLATVTPCGAGAHDLAAFAPSPALFRLVHALKYEGCTELVPWFGARLARVARRLPRAPHVLVPVPLHPERLAARGFNQSALLARDVGARLGLPVWESLLARHKPTQPLARLAHAERRIEVRDAFVRGPAGYDAGIGIVLVDDVVTTGSTRDAARAALGPRWGARSVFLGLCRARDAAPWDPPVAVPAQPS